MNDEETPDSGPAEVWEGIRQNCDCGVWDLAFVDQVSEDWDEKCWSENLAERAAAQIQAGHAESFANGADWMARWIDAILGMAEAIRQRERERPKRELDAWYDDWQAHSITNQHTFNEALSDAIDHPQRFVGLDRGKK